MKIFQSLGWSFVDLVMSSNQTFRGFVSFKAKEYQRTDKSGLPFMSVQTFIEWFFAWASRMMIEFRQACHWCPPGPPKVLACDGTKIGMGFKQSFVTPIEKPELQFHSNSIPSRLNRCFLQANVKSAESHKSYANAREFMKIMCQLVLTNQSKKLEEENHTRSIASLRQYLPEQAIASFNVMVQTDDLAVKIVYATFYNLLSYDDSLDAVIPLEICAELLQFIECIELGIANQDSLLYITTKLKYFNAPLVQLISFTGQMPSQDIISLLRCCIEIVYKIHENDVPPDPAVPIADTYNPPKFGRAYYFSSHGCQVRRLRQFPIDARKKGSNFDDSPDAYCLKKFPQVSKKGTNYLFLWFCPHHGHCYGYHIIPGSEGRKDPSASLYMYTEECPEVVLYDFTCSLSEYTHNRESGYFGRTRFYHDVFHGYTHKCSPAFRCDTLHGFDTVNSSICEQFNSFLQKIKTSAKLMSQVHFSFFLQFFIHIWNEQKKETFRPKRDVRLAGELSLR